MDATSWTRILWIRLDHIGDVVMSLPMLQSLRRALPHADIDCLVRPAVAPVMRAGGLNVNVLSYDSPKFPDRRSRFSIGPFGRGAGLSGTVSLLMQLRRRHYDAAFELRADPVGRVIARFGGVPIRIGPDRVFFEAPGAPNSRWLLTHIVPLAVQPRHSVLNNMELLRAAGLPVAGQEFRFPHNGQASRRVDDKLAERGVTARPILVHVASNDPLRNWNNEKWSVVLKWLSARSGLPLVLTGIPKDRALITDLRRRVGADAALIDAAGLFTLDELPSLFEKARMLVTVDTGPMHIAAMQGTPIVGLMRGDLVPRHHAWGQPSSAVGSVGEDVSQIPVELVQAAIEKQLGVEPTAIKFST